MRNMSSQVEEEHTALDFEHIDGKQKIASRTQPSEVPRAVRHWLDQDSGRLATPTPNSAEFVCPPNTESISVGRAVCDRSEQGIPSPFLQELDKKRAVKFYCAQLMIVDVWMMCAWSCGELWWS